MEPFSFLAHLPKLSRFWVTKFKINSNLSRTWIIKEFKPFERNLINSLKFWLHINFRNMNLHCLPCIQEVIIPLQVVNTTCFLNIQRHGLNLNSHFKTRYIDDYIVETLQNIVATIVTLGWHITRFSWFGNMCRTLCIKVILMIFLKLSSPLWLIQ
jgi:hypothetical protein